MARPRSVEEAKHNLSKKAATVARIMRTPDGKAILEIIEEEFCAGKTGISLLGATPHEMAYRVGAYDVVLYLKQLQAHNNKVTVDPLT